MHISIHIKRFIAMKILLVLIGLLAISFGSASAQKKGDVSGTYQTDFGVLTLSQSGTAVTGSYSYPGPDGKPVAGSLTGTLKGKGLKFTWEQQQGEGKSGGDGQFVFAAGMKSYKGTWSDMKGQSGKWSGTRK
ncbi:MAG: hypothetical protein IAF08_12030 [Rhizobacter sp.]|nr:hypothetical protein [Chlorobiales bacterium]